MKLVYDEVFADRHDALSREWHIKRMKKEEKEALAGRGTGSKPRAEGMETQMDHDTRRRKPMIYYVNAQAGREGNGRKETPFRRIGDAAKIARPGDEVIVAPGIYRESVNPIHAGEEKYYFTAVSMGNPHAVIFCEEPDDIELNIKGPYFEHHPAFPEGVNTEFVRVVDRTRLKMRVWERGSGETLACGTGACASAAAAVLTGKTDRKVTVALRGGELQIEWKEEDGHIYMTGPAETAFEGRVLL